ncbi:hypothetical protein TWF281_008741 [Arthrobotrys megalospora]
MTTVNNDMANTGGPKAHRVCFNDIIRRLELEEREVAALAPVLRNKISSIIDLVVQDLLEYREQAALEIGSVHHLYVRARALSQPRIKRGPNAWNLFIREQFGGASIAAASSSLSDASVYLSQQWRNLPNDRKMKYSQEAREAPKQAKSATEQPMSSIYEYLQSKMADLESTGKHGLFIITDGREVIHFGGTSSGRQYVGELDALNLGSETFLQTVSAAQACERIAVARSVLQAHAPQVLHALFSRRITSRQIYN